jgi:hypothetical protein
MFSLAVICQITASENILTRRRICEEKDILTEYFILLKFFKQGYVI